MTDSAVSGGTVDGAKKGEGNVDALASDDKAPKPQLEKRVCLLVLGMHRSGTNALARVLSLMGAALPKHLRDSLSGNTTGHWESQRLVEYNDRLVAELGSSWDDWRALDVACLGVRRTEEIRSELVRIISADFHDAPLFVLNDPRICRIAPLVLDALDNAGTETCSIIVVRNPLEVAESLQRRGWIPEFTRADAGLLWLRHMLDAEAATRDRPRALVRYDSLLSDWKGALTALTGQLAIRWPYAPDEVARQVDHFLSLKQGHHRRTSEDVVLDPVLRHWVSEAYAAFLVLERNPLSQSALERLVRIRSEFDCAAPIMQYMTNEIRRTTEATNMCLRAQLAMTENQFEAATATLINSGQKRVAAESETQRIKAELLAAETKFAEQKIAFTELDLRKAEVSKNLKMCESKIEELNDRLSRSNYEVVIARQSLVETRRNKEEMNARFAQLDARAKQLDEAAATKEMQLRAAELRLAKAEAMNNAYRCSTSWRLTAPLRVIKTLPDHFFQACRAARNAVVIGGGFLATLRKFLRVYREEGKAGVKSRYEFAVNLQFPRTIALQPLVIEQHSQLHPHCKSSHAIVTEPGLQASEKAGSFLNSHKLRLTEVKRALLQEQRPLIDRIASWAKPTNGELLTFQEAEQRWLTVAPHFGRGLIISLTHDDYHRVVGGVQLCLQLEELEFSKNGYVYLALHPSEPLPVLARAIDLNGFQFQAVLNGERLGSITASTLHSLLQRYVPPGEGICCIVHSLLGHAPEVLTHLFRGFAIKRALFWIHDYFSICPNHVLLRNDVAFCNAPSLQSLSCYTCNYGQERNQHLERLETLFTNIRFDIVSPSHFALDFWQKHTNLRYRHSSVLPLCNLMSRRTLAPSAPPDHRNPVRIAFLGHSVLHKGWHVFAELINIFAGDRRYVFHHLGQKKTRVPGVQFTEVSTSAFNPHVMAGTIIKTGIDIALIWPEWPETFSFTYQEAVAGGALVVTNPGSGNIQASIMANGLGHVVMNDTQLMELLHGGELVEMIRRRRAQGRVTYDMKFSALSRSLIA